MATLRARPSPRTRAAAALLPLLAVTLLAAARGGAAQSPTLCPISANQLGSIDYSQVKISCVPAPAGSPPPCKACLCDIGRALFTGLSAAGVDMAALAGGTDETALQGLFQACQISLGAQLVSAAGLDIGLLTDLLTCPTASITPQCVIGPQAADGDPDVTSFGRQDEGYLADTSGPTTTANPVTAAPVAIPATTPAANSTAVTAPGTAAPDVGTADPASPATLSAPVAIEPAEPARPSGSPANTSGVAVQAPAPSSGFTGAAAPGMAPSSDSDSDRDSDSAATAPQEGNPSTPVPATKAPASSQHSSSPASNGSGTSSSSSSSSSPASSSGSAATGEALHASPVGHGTGGASGDSSVRAPAAAPQGGSATALRGRAGPMLLVAVAAAAVARVLAVGGPLAPAARGVHPLK